MQSEVEMDKLMAQLQEVDDKIKEEVLLPLHLNASLNAYLKRRSCSPCTLMPTSIPTQYLPYLP